MSNDPTHPAHRLGRWGERTAAERLRRAGWTVRDAGYRLGRREVDLVVERSGIIAFIEVKTRSGSGFGRPEEAVTWRKRAEIETVARDWLLRHSAEGREIRFDVIAIEVGPGFRISRYAHIEDAWRPGWP